MYDPKLHITQALGQTFPGVEFHVAVAVGPGFSSASVTWTGGRNLPNQADVRQALAQFSYQWASGRPAPHAVEKIEMCYNDPRLLQEFKHLQPIPRDVFGQERLELGFENVRRHLAKVFPDTSFEVSGTLGAMGIDTEVTVRWTEVDDSGPSQADCERALAPFKYPRNKVLDPDERTFKRLFGAFHIISLKKGWAPAPQAPEKDVTPPSPRRLGR